MARVTRIAGTIIVIALVVAAGLWQVAPAQAKGRHEGRSRAAPLLAPGGQSNDDADGANDDSNGSNDSNDNNGANRNDDDRNETEASGVLKSRPADPEVQGEWVVSTATGDVTFTVDANTQFELEDGALAVGSCVEIEANSAAPGVATDIESESANECGGAASASGDD